MKFHNVLADRRLQFARMLSERGDHEAALSLCEETLVLAPDWDIPHFLMAETFEALSRHQDAVTSYTDYLRLAASDIMGAEIRLALLGKAPVPETLPAPYVEALFDEYAGRFEQALLTRLDYRAPWQLRSLIDRLFPDRRAFARLLDLGCGTGLGGEAFRDLAGWMRGVDLSGKMIAEARRKMLYDELVQGDILLGTEASSPAFDLVLAADVLVYIGDLQTVFQTVHNTLQPGGIFAFSVQCSSDGGYKLGQECRYSHHPDYLFRLMELTGFEALASEEAVCRQEAGKDVPGMIVIARRHLLPVGLPEISGDIATGIPMPPKPLMN